METDKETAVGLVRRALMLRAKYRVQTEKQMIPLCLMGVHPHNRARVYPMEDTCVNLGLGIRLSGFSVDEANHEGVCVQEVPADEQRNAAKPSDGSDTSPEEVRETYLAYNKRKTSAVAALKTCSNNTRAISFGTLSHSHLLLYHSHLSQPNGPSRREASTSR